MTDAPKVTPVLTRRQIAGMVREMAEDLHAAARERLSEITDRLESCRRGETLTPPRSRP